jgi:D-glycero-D-manno-heptose 1,7-bisphosphate phosphatase
MASQYSGLSHHPSSLLNALLNSYTYSSIEVPVLLDSKHHWDDNCACRKPQPGMLKEALEHFRLDHRHTLYVGDEITDAIAASSSGIAHILVNKNNIHERSFETLADALPTLLAMIGKVD